MANHRAKLELLPDGVRLAGSDGAEPLEFSYAELSAIWLEDGPGEAEGNVTLVLERRDGELVRVESDEQGRIVLELARRLAASFRPAGVGRSFAVVVPLKPGARERARRLLKQGPPFDPEAARLAVHRVFLSSDEAVFVFEGDPSTLEALLADQKTWEAAVGWRDCIAGLARIAEEAYAWTAPDRNAR
jgi:hypothetical protein